MFVGKQFVVLLVTLIVVTVSASSSGRYPIGRGPNPYYSFVNYGAGACHPSPCENGGLCRSWYGRAFCTCPHGFAGRKCENKFDSCKFNTCQNGGTCVGHGYGFTCKCPPLFIGTFCETVPCCAKCNDDICVPVIVGAGDKKESRINCVVSGDLCNGLSNTQPIKGRYCHDDHDCEADDTCDTVNNICCTDDMCSTTANPTPDFSTHCEENKDCKTGGSICDVTFGVCCRTM